MATPWLDRLSNATTYGELQEVFASIAAEARDTQDPRALAGALDEAVLRIESERVRDEAELGAFETEYGAFKASQRGALGWLRRHLPFTETRRREKAHQEAVSDQRAEILGDVMVIARAEMLREHLLTPSERETGLEAEAWRELLAPDEAPDRLRAYAETLRALGTQVSRSTAFLTHVAQDIAAFEDAPFHAKEERQRQAADIATARAELAVFEARALAVQALRTEALAHAARSVSESLVAESEPFARLSRRIPRLEAARTRASAAEANLTDLQEGMTTLIELERRIGGQPAKRERLEADLRQAHADAQDARALQAEADDALALHEGAYQRALEAETTAREEVRSAQEALGELLERTGQFELEPGQSLGDATPADAHLTRAQAELQRAHAHARTVQEPYESAKATATRAREHTASLDAQVERIERELAAHVERAERLQQDMASSRRELRPLLDHLPALVAQYHDALDGLDRSSRLPLHPDGLRPPARFEVRGFDDDGGDADDLARAEALWKQLAETLADEERALAQDLAAARERRAALWTEHAEALLGADLASELELPG